MRGSGIMNTVHALEIQVDALKLNAKLLKENIDLKAELIKQLQGDLKTLRLGMEDKYEQIEAQIKRIRELERRLPIADPRITG